MVFTINKWRMDPSLNTLTHIKTGEVRRLGEYHFILLETLVKNADTVLSRSFLSAEVWKNRVVGANSLPTAIHALRAAIDDDGKQQEIIKTIPKKGYYFNKSYLTIEGTQEETGSTHSHPDEMTAHSLPENDSILQEQTDLPDPPDSPTLDSSNQKNSIFKQDVNGPHPKLKTQKKWLVALAIIIIAFILLAFIFFIEKTPAPETSDTPVLAKETVKNADRITVYHLYYQGVNKDNNISLDHHLAASIPAINDLLTRQQASMTAIYKISFNKISFNLLITSQCQHTQQLMLVIENWQEQESQLAQILFKETENILNAMPKC